MQEVNAKPIGRVVVATPTLDGNFSAEYLVSILQTVTECGNYGIPVDVTMVRGDCFIDKARNHLIMQFLSMKDVDALFFIDADQGWDPQAFLRMVLDPREIVAAAVPKKVDEMTFNNPALDTDESKNCYVENGLLRASHIGTGFMRIKRTAIERLVAAYPETYSPGDGSKDRHYNLFTSGIIDGQFWGEDLAFCRRWTALGEHIWVDPNASFKHVGRKTYEGNFLKYLQAHCDVKTAEAA